MWELDHRKAEHQRIDTFELWCWRRLLRIPWTPRRSNQSTLKEINPDYSLEGLMMKLKLQYFLATWCKQLTHWKILWCWEKLKTKGEEGGRGWDGWIAAPIHKPDLGHELGQIPGDGEGNKEAWFAAVHRVTKNRTWLSWTELNWNYVFAFVT